VSNLFSRVFGDAGIRGVQSIRWNVDSSPAPAEASDGRFLPWFRFTSNNGRKSSLQREGGGRIEKGNGFGREWVGREKERRKKEGGRMRKFQIAVMVCLFVVFGVCSATAATVLFDYAFNVDGTISSNTAPARQISRPSTPLPGWGRLM